MSTYANPLLDVDFPDPCVIRAADGGFHAYATNGNGNRIQHAESRDLTSFRYVGEALEAPSWSAEGFHWAPDVHCVVDGPRFSPLC